MAWSYALDTLLPDFAYTGTKDEANNAERAAFTALSLYALHQRALARPMHLKGKKSLGTAIAELTVSLVGAVVYWLRAEYNITTSRYANVNDAKDHRF